MAWSAPMTATLNGVISSANFNTYTRDNLNMTLPALASGNSDGWFVSTGANVLKERTIGYGYIGTLETDNTTASNYVDLATPGPIVTLNTGSLALVHYSCWSSGSNSNGAAAMAVQVSGATTIAAATAPLFPAFFDGLSNASYTMRSFTTVATLTPGSNTFKAMYNSFGNSGTQYELRWLVVIPLN